MRTKLSILFAALVVVLSPLLLQAQGQGANGIFWDTNQPDPSGEGTITGTGSYTLASGYKLSGGGITTYAFASGGNYFVSTSTPNPPTAGQWNVNYTDVPPESYFVYGVIEATDGTNTVLLNTSTVQVNVQQKVPPTAPGGKVVLDATKTKGIKNGFNLVGTIVPASGYELQGQKVTYYLFGKTAVAPNLSPRFNMNTTNVSKNEDGSYTLNAVISFAVPGDYNLFVSAPFVKTGTTSVNSGCAGPIAITILAN